MKLKPKGTFPHSHVRGFALVTTLSLMVLLTVVAVGLLTLSSVTLRSSGQGAASATARANARLALMMALGEMQVYLGPDTRVTARAETLANDPRVGATVSPATPQAWWVGVSDSDTSKSLRGSGSPGVAWLVSGLSGATPDSQVTSAPADPVILIGEGSLDLDAVTGGSPLQAGRVILSDSAGRSSGAYAWMVDDHGMKAQLAATRPEVRNDSTAGTAGGPFGGGVIPGTYSISILDRMASLGATTPELLRKLVSANSLPLVNLAADVKRSKFFSYTTSSLGVLSDVRKGGLKKDLTIAFENPSVFSKVFSSGDPSEYILVDPQKRPAELDKGYIHWGILRDFYNIKKHLINTGGVPGLAPTLFQKDGMVNGSTGTPTALPTDSFRLGKLGPHAMAGNAPPSLSTHPYGLIDCSPTKVGNPAGYAFHPISPILSNLQQTGWISKAGTPSTKLRTHVQLFTSHYNPYNINLVLNGKAGSGAGPRLHNYPQVQFTVSGTTINRLEGLNPKLQTHVTEPVTLEPGRGHVMGFESAVTTNGEVDGSSFSQKVGDITGQSIYKEVTATVPDAGNVTLTVEFAQSRPTLMHGVDEEPGNREVTQVFFTPFAWDAIATPQGSRPGKRLSRSVSGSQLNENTKLTMGFRLRTTQEPAAGAIRPLVDANIRAVWSNPRWDSPLNLPLLAAYSADGGGEISNQPIPQMEIGANKRGFAYWGNSRSPSGANDRVILFDVPRRDLVSLGQLQHANVGRFSYEPTYIIGNSYANPRIPLAEWQASIRDTYSSSRSLPWAISGGFNLYDASYLVNEVLFDSYIFSTIPQASDDFGGGGLAGSAGNYSGLIEGSLQLPNPRYLPWRPQGSDFDAARLQDAGTATGGSFFHNAGHLLVDGAFNVNSTSVDAWEAFLSGTHRLPVAKLGANGVVTGFTATERVRFPRAASHLGDGMTTSAIDENYWIGFRELEQSEVRELAEAIVQQVKLRGPFLSLGAFVNRKLDDSDAGKSGTLQAALDATVNEGLNSTYEAPADSVRGSTQGAGFPGQLLQGDILQALAPCMTVRSDTFTIRGYGEARAPDNRITARAWCEATVQRMPDPMASATPASALAELIQPGSPFGRRFNILTFRWLHPDEV
jgi:hypothetical protein